MSRTDNSKSIRILTATDPAADQEMFSNFSPRISMPLGAL
jgi:hypothetical protein